MRNLLLTHIILWCLLQLLFSCKQGDIDSEIMDSDTIESCQILRLLSNGKDVSLKDKHISGNLNFCEVSGDNDFETTYINNAICFVGCTFADSVCTTYSNGDRYCVFGRKVIFNYCEFRQAVDFSKTEFKDKFRSDMSRFCCSAKFSGSIFRNTSDFTAANFMDDVMFVGCVFLLKANFKKSFFKRGAVFQFLQFGMGANFEQSYFYGYTEFNSVNADFATNFKGCKFLGNTLFSNSLFFRDLNFMGCTFNPKFEFNKNRVIQRLLKDDTVKIDFNNQINMSL